jgi:hypothetical protein
VSKEPKQIVPSDSTAASDTFELAANFQLIFPAGLTENKKPSTVPA